MSRLKLTAASLSVLGCITLAMQALCAQGDSDDRPAMSEGSGSALSIKGDATALHVEVRHTTIADVLSALAVRYRASVSLDEVIEGN